MKEKKEQKSGVDFVFHQQRNNFQFCLETPKAAPRGHTTLILQKQIHVWFLFCHDAMRHVSSRSSSNVAVN